MYQANVDISSRYDGKIVSLQYGVGDMAKVGAPLLIIETDEGEMTETATPATEAATEITTNKDAHAANTNAKMRN